MEIAVIGNGDFTLGFRLAGIKKVFLADQTNYQEKMQEAMADAHVGILAVNAEDLQYLSANVKARVMDSIQPVVVPVGGDQSDLREKVRKVIGVDLFKTEDE